MKFLGILLAMFFAAPAFSAVPNLELQSTSIRSPEPLTTDQLATIDPGQPNPQLRRWALDRQLVLGGLKPRKLKVGLVGVDARDLQSKIVIHLRGPGPWYQGIDQFPCTEKPNPRFETAEGALQAARDAAALWENLLTREKLRLAANLAKVAAPRDRSAMSKAARVFEEWQIRLDREWRARVESDVIPAQWRRYAHEASLSHACRKGPRPAPDPETWMVPELAAVVTSNPAPRPEKGVNPDTGAKTGGNDFGRFLTRAPSRRWNGYYGVRVDVRIADRILNGQFVIKPDATRSVFSPEWLRAQGVPSVWIEVPEAEPEHVRIASGEDRAGLAKIALVEDALISNYRLSQNRYGIFETDLFDQPENFAPCCDGVFGRDFLRRNIVEFRPNQAAKFTNEILIWPIPAFNAPADYSWVAVQEMPDGKLAVECSERVRKLGSAKLCEDPSQVLLKNTGPIIFDLPHGRIWYSDQEKTAPDYRNRTGLAVEYVFKQGGDRVLELVHLGQAEPARALEKEGLKRGAEITGVDGLPAAEMDLWEVNRHLDGVYGNFLTLKWKLGKAEKSVSVPLSKN